METVEFHGGTVPGLAHPRFAWCLSERIVVSGNGMDEISLASTTFRGHPSLPSTTREQCSPPLLPFSLICSLLCMRAFNDGTSTAVCPRALTFRFGVPHDPVASLSALNLATWRHHQLMTLHRDQNQHRLHNKPSTSPGPSVRKAGRLGSRSWPRSPTNIIRHRRGVTARRDLLSSDMGH